MIQIIALLYASNHGIKGLREFEAQAITILREHKGVLISSSSNDIQSPQEPDEIHVIQFPSSENFQAYKNDPRLLRLASLKAQTIRKMDVYITNSFHQY